MGRGRQKAKHTKVARELKYSSPTTNLSALERELGAQSSEPDYEDKWAHLVEDDDEDTADDADEAEDDAQTA